MYQPLIKFHPYPAIITQVLYIFAHANNILKRLNKMVLKGLKLEYKITLLNHF